MGSAMAGRRDDTVGLKDVSEGTERRTAVDADLVVPLQRTVAGPEFPSQRAAPVESSAIEADRVVTSPPPDPSGRGRRVVVELLTGTALGFGAAFALGAPPLAVVLVVLWATLSYARVPTLGGPLLRQLKPLATACVLVVALAGVLFSVGLVAGSTQAVVVPSVLLATGGAALVRVLRVRRAGPVRIIVVGDVMEASRWSGAWRERRDVDVVGAVLVDPDTNTESLPPHLDGVPASRSLEDLAARVEAWHADLVVFVPSPGLSKARVRRASWLLEGSKASLAVAGLFDSVAPHRVTPGVVGGETLCEVEPPRRSSLVIALKHLFDRLAGAFLLLMAAPCIAIMGIVIRLDSPGPAIFRQRRVGRHGHVFTVYKMRTMRTGADQVKHQLAPANEAGGVLFKIRKDPRTTRVGHFLRRSSLDELPQLLNVVRGEMSLIGPRPCLPSETAGMSSDELRRLVVKPGMTGLWQVSGRSNLGWTEAAELDTWYADNWTLGKDAEIAFRTVGAVLGGRGAY